MMDHHADASASVNATTPAASAGMRAHGSAQAHGPGCGCGCQASHHGGHHSHGHHSHHAEQQTLHDFVLNLIADPAAKDAFLLDPHSCLRDAGLGELSLADVHDVLTLVLDSIPVQGPASVAQLDALNIGSVTEQPGAVVAQLQAVLHQVGVSNSHGATQDFNVVSTATSAVLPAASGLGLGAEVLPGIGVAASGSGAVLDLSGTHDLANTLDGGVLGTTGHEVTGVVGTADGLVNGAPGLGGPSVVDGVVGTATGLFGGSPAANLLGGSPLGGILGTVHGVVGNTAGGPVGNGATGLLGNAVNGIAAGTVSGVLGTSPVDGVLGTVHGATQTVGGVAHGTGLDGATHTVGGVVHGTGLDAVTGTAGGAVHGTGLDSVTGSVGSTVQGVTGTGAHGLLGGVTGTADSAVHGVTGTDTHGLLGGVTGTVGDTLGSAGVGNVTGDPGGQSHADTSAQVDASHHGLLDGLH
ncbi:hypothetical protein HC031_04595 [Planosporangium thailandense]|uniref:Collagen-like protein n=1 Tax=Planosporangium thailandense TaxID=765197 RepID=A0ABX0XSY5_9ACTN|nr:IniB N-terminal domain-containing protein [Planosporangium thailandense]NJC69007.1 hypothetical protein [Planosporangium thailandense]